MKLWLVRDSSSHPLPIFSRSLHPPHTHKTEPHPSLPRSRARSLDGAGREGGGGVLQDGAQVEDPAGPHRAPPQPRAGPLRGSNFPEIYCSLVSDRHLVPVGSPLSTKLCFVHQPLSPREKVLKM